jgi:predicted permease
MNPLTNLVAGLQSILRKQRTECELEEELDSYLEASAAHKRNSGIDPKSARRLAKIEIGSRNAVKHQVWASRWESHFDNLFTDLRLGIRTLTKSPGFALVALLSLTLGIGANTAIFSLLNAVLLGPLPVFQPSQLVLFGAGKWVGSIGGMPNRSWQLFSYPFYKAFSSQDSPFSAVAATSSIQMGSHVSLNGGSPEPLRMDLVSGNYFQLLGVPAALGRVLGPSDESAPGGNPVAVASYGWFQRHFQTNSAALGQSIHIQGRDYTLIGVAQPGFTGHSPAEPADLWIPITMEKEISPGWNGLLDQDFQSLYLIARLKPGLTMAQAASPTNLLFRNIIRSEYLTGNLSPRDLAGLSHAEIRLNPFAGGLPGMAHRFSAPLEILMGLATLVLLIACANIANMLLARGIARIREIAVRQALGATRSRIVLQLLTESLLLSLAGAALGILLAWRGTHLLLKLGSQGPKAIPLDLTPDYRVLVFTLGVTLLTALLFGIAPALRATRIELTPALKEGRGSSSASAHSTLSRSLIAGQIALCLLLLVSAGLFLRSLVNLARVDLGFDPNNVTVFTLDEYSANLPLDARLTLLQQQIEQNVRAIPGVQSASFSMFTFNQGEWSNGILMQGVPRTKENSDDVLFNVIGDEHLKTVGIPLLSGRNFNAQDTATGPQVAIVNQALARRFLGGASPLGHRFLLCDDTSHCPPQTPDIEIVGVVRDAHYVSLGESQEMAVYFPYTQHIQYFGNFSVRSSLAPSTLIPSVRRALAQANPNIAIGQVVSLKDQVMGSVATQRLVGLLSAFFAALAVFLAAIGIYGLISYSVVRRTNEIGIRLALGAQTGTLLWMVLRESLLLLAIGLAIGLPTALASTGILRNLLYQLSPTDPWTFALSAIVVAAMTLLAAWLPARRAAKVDPMVALRYD